VIAWYISPGRDEISQLHVAADKSYYNGGASNRSLSYTASVRQGCHSEDPGANRDTSFSFKTAPMRLEARSARLQTAFEFFAGQRFLEHFIAHMHSLEAHLRLLEFRLW
jgi:hypothetical protein